MSLIMMPSLSSSKVSRPRGHSCVLHSLDKLYALDQAARRPAADLDDFYDDANDHDVGDHKFDGLCDRLDVLGNGSWCRSRRGNYNIT